MVPKTRTAMGWAPLLLACACGRAPAPAGSASAQQAIAAPAVSAPVVAARASASAVVTAPSYACTELPLFAYYQAGGAVLEQSPTHLKLHLLINLHQLDCPAPDATGHNLVVALTLEPVGEHCWVRGGSVKATAFSLDGESRKDWQDELRPDGAIDLAAVDPSNAVLRAVTSPTALVLTPDDYWLFEDVKPGAPLYPRLQGEDDGSCCYGFTGAATQYWEYEYAPSFPVEPAPSDAAELTRFNVWAKRSGLRHRLGQLVRNGFDLRASDKVTIDLASTEQPLAATVQVTAKNPEGELDYAVLQFSRKPCSTCVDGVSGWWLWKASNPD